MDRNAFASLATFKLPSPCRLLASACCPDKDLVVLIARLGGRDRISLWKMQGSRKWEVDIAADDVPATVAGLAWHPDGQTIAVVHESGLITMHSVQDGRTERSLSINSYREAQTVTKVIGVWWFPGPSESTTDVIPDIFKRNGVKTGSALSILKILPMLDPLKETSGHVTATDLFAFQGTQTRSTRQVSVPDVISQWPSLAPILEDISISPPDQTDENYKSGSQGSSSRKPDEDSLLVLADERGGLHLFLAGTYCLGTIALPGGHPPIFLYKHPGKPVLLFHSESPEGDLFSVVVQPTPVNIPLLGTLAVRDFARLSSAARELTRYIMSVLDELKEGWLSSTSVTGAREIGKTWVASLEKRLKEEYEENPDVVFELTSFLVTGSMSEGLSDFIVSSDQTSERALQKWDNAVTDALTKMCDYSNMRVIPALQRLHIVLDEIHGWSLMSHYAAFGLDTGDIITCLHLVEHGIFVSAWLAAEAKKELRTFKHFLNFIRYEMTVANMSGESQTFLDYDILEVNNYLMSGFMTSQIDRWFTGSAPQFNPGELCTSQTPKSLDEALQLAHTAFQDPSQTAWQPVGISLDVTRIEFSQLDRNLDALIQELAIRCQRVFAQASPATARSATVPADGGAVPTKARELSPTPENNCLFIRQRVVCDDNEVSGVFLSAKRVVQLYLAMPYGQYTRMAESFEVAILECSVDTNNDGGGELDMLDGEFFDDEVIVLVYRIKGTQGPIYVGTMNYTMLRYQRLESEGYVNGPAQKDMIVDMLQRWKEGHLMGGGVPITKCRRLSACKSGPISMALNGRVGRRVVCVLGGDGVTMEVIDMEGDEMEADEESEMEMVSRDMIVTEGDLGP
ncbi:anaphase-promoting complex, cyclosome, subunit 4-domain-containing protein [Pisolithus marmoratus]|nr:anaphase-promoting complex, cyclosome, subunit 4-domain-containing protein [Pisolithus marmoratus]